jgi:hypothetical protein
LLGSVAEGLRLFWGINMRQSNFICGSGGAVEDSQGVTIGDADDFASESGRGPLREADGLSAGSDTNDKRGGSDSGAG